MNRSKVCLILLFCYNLGMLSGQNLSTIQINSNFQQQKLEQVLLQLEKDYNIRFYYKPEWLPTTFKSYQFEQVPLNETLAQLLTETDLDYINFNNYGIIIAPKSQLNRVYTTDFYKAQYENKIKKAETADISGETIIIGDSTQIDADGLVEVKGKITDDFSGEPLIGVTLLVKGSGQGTSTEADGSYSLSLPLGTHLLSIQGIGYREVFKQLEVYSDDEFNFRLDVKSFQLEQVTVEAKADDRNVSSSQMGLTELSVQELREIPSFLGEVDVIKGLLTLPGVTNVGEGAGGFNVRGGNIDQNLILQDGAMVFNSSHVLGFFSIFNSDALEGVALYKGHIPARFGGRISAVLDVTTKEGDFKKIKVAGGLGLISSRLMIEGPIFKDKTSFLISGRASYSDWILRLISIKEVRESSASFYDVNAKITQRIGENTKLSLSFYQSDDFFRYSDQFGYDWKTQLLTFKWRQIYNARFSSIFTAISGDYNSGYFQPEGLDAFRLENGIEYFKLKQNFFYAPSEKHGINFGADWIAYNGKPETLQPQGDISQLVFQQVDKEQAQEYGIYADWDFQLNEVISFSAGLRYSFFRNIGPGSVFAYKEGEPLSSTTIIDTTIFNNNALIRDFSGLEPRVSLKIGLGTSASIKLSYNHLLQYVHLVSNTSAATPVDIWQMSNAFITPQEADNFSLGFFKNFKNNSWETSVELYYKSINSLIEYKDFADLFLNDHLETELLIGRGRSYGIELAINKTVGKWTGSFSYTYSRTERQAIGKTLQETINRGAWFPSNFDKPHQVNILTKYKPNKKKTLSLNFTYNTGRPTTIPINSYSVNNVIVPNYSNRNQFRIPDFHRLDMSYTINSAVLKRKGFKGSLTFSIYNIYFRKNAFSVFYKRDPDNFFPEAFQLSVLGSAFPAVTYNFRF